MGPFYHALVASGMGRFAAFAAVLRAACTLRKSRRRERLEIALMQRKEVCDIKDAVVGFARDFASKRGKVTEQIAKSQLLDDLYRREHSSRMLEVALKELIREGNLKVVPAEMKETVYATTTRRYVSKTRVLTGLLNKLGVYSRFVASHRPYPEPRNYDIE